MRSLNQCSFIGNLTREPETRAMPNGNQVANITIAVNDSYKDKSGNMVDQAEFVRVVFFGKPAEHAGQYLSKGSKIYVSGKFKTRKWTDNAGVEKYSTEILVDGFSGVLQFLDSKPEGQRPQQQQGGYQNPQQAPSQQYPQDDADNVPF